MNWKCCILCLSTFSCRYSVGRTILMWLKTSWKEWILQTLRYMFKGGYSRNLSERCIIPPISDVFLFKDNIFLRNVVEAFERKYNFNYKGIQVSPCTPTLTNCESIDMSKSPYSYKGKLLSYIHLIFRLRPSCLQLTKIVRGFIVKVWYRGTKSIFFKLGWLCNFPSWLIASWCYGTCDVIVGEWGQISLTDCLHSFIPQ